MSDLISRQEVNKVVDELEVYTVGRLNTQKVEISVLQLQRFINALKEIPTAYDVDKVVEELNEQWNDVNCIDDDMYYIGVANGLADAINIVRKDGVE